VIERTQRWLAAFLVAVVLATLVAACGRQGPLVHPGEEEPKRAKEVF